MAIAEDRWLSARLGIPAFTVAPEDAAALAQRVGDGDGESAFYQAKVPCERVEDVRALCAGGMYVVDVNLTLGRSPEKLPESGDWTVVEAREDDWEVLLEIAGSAYRYSRFHLDPAVSDAEAHAIKRAWLESYRSGERGDHVLAALDGDERAVGFLAVLIQDGTHVVDLVAVAPDAQGRGAGRALAAAVVNRAQDAGADAVRVGTQAANATATALYEQLGFRLLASTYNLHLRVG